MKVCDVDGGAEGVTTYELVPTGDAREVGAQVFDLCAECREVLAAEGVVRGIRLRARNRPLK